jgi:hypothetical protein
MNSLTTGNHSMEFETTPVPEPEMICRHRPPRWLFFKASRNREIVGIARLVLEPRHHLRMAQDDGGGAKQGRDRGSWSANSPASILADPPPEGRVCGRHAS